MIPRHVPLVETTRGGTTECVHYGSIAVVDPAGKLVSAVGDPDSLNFTRSALKPLQALPFVEDGGLGRYGFTSHELAMMCASHSGEAVHVGIVQRMLAAAGLDDSALQCGCHAPGYFAATETHGSVRGEVVAAVSQLLRQARGLSRVLPHARPAHRNLPRQRSPVAAADSHDRRALRPGRRHRAGHRWLQRTELRAAAAAAGADLCAARGAGDAGTGSACSSR